MAVMARKKVHRRLGTAHCLHLQCRGVCQQEAVSFILVSSLLLDPENGNSMVQQNVSGLLPDYTWRYILEDSTLQLTYCRDFSDYRQVLD
jgi:hypothetical protein